MLGLVLGIPSDKWHGMTSDGNSDNTSDNASDYKQEKPNV